MEDSTKQVTIRERFWAFLNTQLGIWFLSALFLTGIGSVYTTHQNNLAKEKEIARQHTEKENEIARQQIEKQREQAKADEAREFERKQQVEKLDLEISFRYAVILQTLAEVYYNQAIDPAEKKRLILEAVANLRPPELGAKLVRDRDYRDLWLFQEHKDLGMFGVYAELYRNLRGTQQAKFKEEIATISSNPFRSTDLANAFAVGEVIQKRLVADRFRKGTDFGYLDCAPGVATSPETSATQARAYNPFC
jgi:cell division protein FtsL